jgi:hypothetical protein
MLAAFAPRAADAQVGFLPSQSPYEDLKPNQELTFLFGHLGSSPGIAGVLPKSSLFGGLRYDVPLGGPAFFMARYLFAPSERSFLLPTKTASTRVLGTTSTRMHAVDVGFDIALTGRKTWHRLVPAVQFGTGLVSDFAKADTGGYKFGTKFDFTYGANLRYVLRNGVGIRADATNLYWKNTYPDSYALRNPTDTSAVLASTTDRAAWKGHWAFSIGLVLPIFR